MTIQQRRIANWWEDGLGSFTPPGHWNRFAKEAIVRHKLNPLHSARVFAYMNTDIIDAGGASGIPNIITIIPDLLRLFQGSRPYWEHQISLLIPRVIVRSLRPGQSCFPISSQQKPRSYGHGQQLCQDFTEVSTTALTLR